MEKTKEDPAKLLTENILLKKLKKMQIIGMIIYVVGFAWLCYLTTWTIPVAITVMLWGNNMESKSKIVNDFYDIMKGLFVSK